MPLGTHISGLSHTEPLLLPSAQHRSLPLQQQAQPWLSNPPGDKLAPHQPPQPPQPLPALTRMFGLLILPAEFSAVQK